MNDSDPSVCPDKEAELNSLQWRISQALDCSPTNKEHVARSQLVTSRTNVTLHGDGWMICDFTSFSTVFQSYQDDGRLIMKGCVQ